MLVESKTNQFEIVFKLLARFSAQFRIKESFNMLTQQFGIKKTLSFSGPCRGVQTAKLTNDSARTNLEK